MIFISQRKLRITVWKTIRILMHGNTKKEKAPGSLLKGPGYFYAHGHQNEIVQRTSRKDAPFPLDCANPHMEIYC